MVRMKRISTDFSVFVIFIFFVFFASAISKSSLFDSAKFIIVQLAFIYIPGCAFQKLLSISYKNSLTKRLVSYLLGYALSIVVYLTLLILALQHMVLNIYCIVFFVSVVFLFMSKDQMCNGGTNNKEVLCFSLIFLLSLAVGFVLFQCNNISPMLKEGHVSFNQDLVFWMRNAVAATKGYPLPDLSVLGKKLYYHYFTSAHLAFLHFTTGIELFDLCFVYSYIITELLLVSGLYILCKELIYNMKYMFGAMCFILFTVNLDFFTHVFFNSHLHVASFGFAEGLGMFCVSFYFYLRIIRCDRTKWRLLLMASLFFIITTGLKGPVAAVLLVGFASGSLILMFMKDRFLFGAFSGLVLLVSFLIPMFLFVMNLHAEPKGGGNVLGLTISATDTIFHSHYYEKAYLLMLNIGIMKPLSYFIIFIVYLFSVFLIPLMAFIVSYNNKKVTDCELIIIIMVFVGIFLGMFVSQKGMSQCYFLYVSIALLFMLTFTWLQKRELDKGASYKIRLIFFLGILLFFAHYFKTASSNILSLANSSSLRMQLDGKKSSLSNENETGLSISQREFEGLKWGRSHVPASAVLLSNKILSSDMGSRSFWVSSIIERQSFLESYSYSGLTKEKIASRYMLIDSFYRGSDNACRMLKQNGVTHAVIFKGITPQNYPISCKVIYENNDMIIVVL